MTIPEHPTNLDAPVTGSDLAVMARDLLTSMNRVVAEQVRQPLNAETIFNVLHADSMRDSEPDGPIREPGDDVEVLSDSDMVEWLTERAQKARDNGKYGTAHAHELSATRIDERSDQIETARETIERLVAEIAERDERLADMQRRIDSLNYALTGMREGPYVHTTDRDADRE